MAETKAAKGLDRAAVQELIEHGARLFAGTEAADSASAGIAAAVEAVYQSSRAAGHDGLLVSGIRIGFGGVGGEEGESADTASPVDSMGAHKRLPKTIGGGDGRDVVCFLLSAGPPAVYFCFEGGWPIGPGPGWPR